MLVVHVGDNADDAPEGEWRCGSRRHQVTIQRVAVREQSLREALTDNRDRLGVAAVSVGELAAVDEPDAERRKEIRRHEADSRARRQFAIGGSVSLGREAGVDVGAVVAGVPPGHEAADGYAIDTGQPGDSPSRLVVEVEGLRVTARNTGRR